MAASVPQEGSYLFLRNLFPTYLDYLIELPILESVIKCVVVPLQITPSKFNAHVHSIRNRLTVLKRDRGEYIKPSDVNSLYQAVVKQGVWVATGFDLSLSLSSSHETQ